MYKVVYKQYPTSPVSHTLYYATLGEASHYADGLRTQGYDVTTSKAGAISMANGIVTTEVKGIWYYVKVDRRRSGDWYLVRQPKKATPWHKMPAYIQSITQFEQYQLIEA